MAHTLLAASMVADMASPGGGESPATGPVRSTRSGWRRWLVAGPPVGANPVGGGSSDGRALAFQAGCRGFESRPPLRTAIDRRIRPGCGASRWLGGAVLVYSVIQVSRYLFRARFDGSSRVRSLLNVVSATSAEVALSVNLRCFRGPRRLVDANAVLAIWSDHSWIRLVILPSMIALAGRCVP